MCGIEQIRKAFACLIDSSLKNKNVAQAPYCWSRFIAGDLLFVGRPGRASGEGDLIDGGLRNRGEIMNTNNLAGMCAGLLFSAVLGGCGGGGDSGSGSASDMPPTIQAVYEGTFSGGTFDGLAHQTFVLDNYQVYAFYGFPINGLVATGFLQGDGTLSNGSFSSNNLKDFSVTGTVQSGTLSASYNQGVSLNGSITSGPTTSTFTGVPLKSSQYNFNTAANPANISGTWSVKDMNADDVTVTIAANGTLNGTFSTGPSATCSFSGTMTPRASGKNVFDLALTFGSAPCALATVQISGVAIEYRLPNGKQQFIVAGTDTTRTTGAAFLGTR
jgi:hypothetical protein